MVNDVHIREYLLGRLDDAELVERIEEQTLIDHDFSVRVDVVEDEIIEECIEDALSVEDLQAVEKHFFRPPERQRKFRNARLLRSHLAGTWASQENVKQPQALGLFVKVWAAMRVRPSFRTCSETAVAVLFITSTLYFMNQRRELEVAVMRGTQQLAEDRQRSSAANQQPESAHQLVGPATPGTSDQRQLFYAASHQQQHTDTHVLQSSIAMLTLVNPGLQRGRSELPEINIGTATRTLHIDIALMSTAVGECRVQLRRAGETEWSRDGISASAAPGGAILALDIPTETFSQGAYEVLVMQRGERKTSYWFQVSSLK